MLNKFADVVLALLRGLNIARRMPLRSLRPCWAGFLSILRGMLLLFQTCRSVTYSRAYRVVPQPA